ncbi:glucose-1-phosphate cytidylyltransferase [Neobacillus sp. OS1-2]|uniref:glucose-1-phosphate cytidylyltransferase n=1 Tax=Neobacillus sp. OS1-2 TaxID=3070680 RepID=UPI0027E1EF85|nr:glucose-1-phosphate cytidylyltransferase [Neobacillus sp. OS1-2]WML39952.1 glucose-1-phosphate cytidylyltransferase [Neobacillus sp. OS1-2]
MKVVILCGGLGTRMSELTNEIPKPLVQIGDKPIIWHIMKIYQQYGFNEFVLLLGYKGEKIKEYFMDYEWKNNSFTMDSQDGQVQILGQTEKWKITFVDTGLETMTGSRIKRAQKYIGDESFMLTYGDGLSDINLQDLLKFHRTKGTIATVTGIKKKSQFGILAINQGMADSFEEKTKVEGIVNGGFFVFQPEVFNYLTDDTTCVFEEEPMKELTKARQLSVYLHEGFWTAIDTYKNVLEINKLWEQGNRLWLPKQK